LFSAVRFVFTLVAALGAFGGEPFPVIPSGLSQRCTPDAADRITPFFVDGDARSKVGYGRKTEENMLCSRFTAHEPQRTSNGVGRRRPAGHARRLIPRQLDTISRTGVSQADGSRIVEVDMPSSSLAHY
jgi:hypothetical protein